MGSLLQGLEGSDKIFKSVCRIFAGTSKIARDPVRSWKIFEDLSEDPNKLSSRSTESHFNRSLQRILRWFPKGCPIFCCLFCDCLNRWFDCLTVEFEQLWFSFHCMILVSLLSCLFISFWLPGDNSFVPVEGFDTVILSYTWQLGITFFWVKCINVKHLSWEVQDSFQRWPDNF